MRKRHRNSILSAGVFAIASLSMAASANAMWMTPQQMPLNRVISNLDQWVKVHPNDADAYFSLARARSYAFATSSGTIAVHEVSGRPIVSLPPSTLRVSLDATKDTKSALRHLDAGIRAFNSAIKLKPAAAEYRYGLASLLENGLSVRGTAKAFPMLDVETAQADSYASRVADITDLAEPGKLKMLRDILFPASQEFRDGELVHAAEHALLHARYKGGDSTPQSVLDLIADAWVLEMDEQYFVASCMALPGESTYTKQGMFDVRTFIACQAAQDYLRVSKSVVPNENYPVRMAATKAVVKAFEDLPPCNLVTPLVIPLVGADSIFGILDPHACVQFDLDGTGRKQTYCWLTPSAGLLVWDPTHTGKITSGRQLFGSATWWLFFKDGFAALASLDDNHDGFIRGDELSGLAVWVDANGNGISDPGEVMPIQKLSITSLSCRSTGHDGASLISSGGVEFSDGTRRPLWDWITTPLSIEQSADLKK